MGVRGIDELVAVLPPAAAEPARAVAQSLADLTSLRHSALAPEDVRALGELWERFTAQVGSGRLAVLAAMDARDDVIPKAKVGDAGAVFAHHVLGQRHGTARRDGRWAWLLRPEVGDLPAVGAALAAGDITTAHVEVAIRAHRDLGAQAREALVECQIPEVVSDDGDVGAAVERGEQLRAALAGLSNAFTARVRQILVVDVLLAHYARTFSVVELEAVAARIVRTLNAPNPKGAHERRFLFMSQLPDGSWRGRFECGPEQGLRIKRALAAFSAPRPGAGIDADSVRHDIPDSRDLGARQIDAVTDIITLALAKTGLTLPDDHHSSSSNGPGTRPADGLDTDGPDTDGLDTAGPGDAHLTTGGPAAGGSGAADEFRGARDPEYQDAEPDQPPDEPPPGEGESVVLRQPGALVAPYPCAEIVVVAGIEHLAAAWAPAPTPSRSTPRRASPAGYATASATASARIENNQADSRQPKNPPKNIPAKSPAKNAAIPVEIPVGVPAKNVLKSDPGRRRREDPHAPTSTPLPLGTVSARQNEQAATSPVWDGWRVPCPPTEYPPGSTMPARSTPTPWNCSPATPPSARRCSPRAARCSTWAAPSAWPARRRRPRCSPGTAAASSPGCTVPGDACDAHHVSWWTRGGPTDLDNLALACGRHHTEIHQRTWEIQIHGGIPWVTPPSWIDRSRRPLRNAAHRPGSRAA